MFRKASGFALPAAIFVLVVLAALGTFAASLAAFQHGGLALDVLGVRAYQAARAGMEWGLYQTVTAASSSCSSGGGEVAMSATTLQELTVTVRCSQVASEDGQTIYTVEAWACNRPAASSPKCPGDATVDGYIERKLSAVVAK